MKVEASMADAFDCVYLAGGHGCCVDFVGVRLRSSRRWSKPRLPRARSWRRTATAPWACSSAGPSTARRSSRARGHGLYEYRRGPGRRRTGWVKGNSVFMEDEFEIGRGLQEGRPWTSPCMQGGSPHHCPEPSVGGRLCGGGDRGAGVSTAPSTRVYDAVSRITVGKTLLERQVVLLLRRRGGSRLLVRDGRRVIVI